MWLWKIVATSLIVVAAMIALFYTGLTYNKVVDIQNTINRISRIQVCETSTVRDTDEWNLCIARAQVK